MHPPRLGNAPERLIWTRRLPDTALNERRVIDRNLRVGEPVLTDCDQPKIFVSAHSRRYARQVACWCGAWITRLKDRSAACGGRRLPWRLGLEKARSGYLARLAGP